MKFNKTTPSRLGESGATNRRVPAAAGAAGDAAAVAAGDSAAAPREIGDDAASAAEIGDSAAGAAGDGAAAPLEMGDAAAGAAGDGAADAAAAGAAGDGAAAPLEMGDAAAGAAETGGTAETGGRRSARAGRVGLRDLLSGEVLTREGVLANVPYLVFVAGLFVAYVALGYQFERIEREKQKTLRRVKELNAEFKSLEAQFETQLQQSQVERAVEPLGLEQSLKPPFIIEVQPLENEAP